MPPAQEQTVPTLRSHLGPDPVLAPGPQTQLAGVRALRLELLAFVAALADKPLEEVNQHALAQAHDMLKQIAEFELELVGSPPLTGQPSSKFAPHVELPPEPVTSPREARPGKLNDGPSLGSSNPKQCQA